PLAALKIRPRLQFVSMQYLDNSEDDDYSELAPGLIDPAFLNADGSLRYRKTLPAYTTLGLDLAGNWTMGSSLELELSLHGDNLLDREYQNNGYWNDWVEGAAGYRPQPELYPAAGRSFMAGLALRF
ncbi:MAG: TonB-dependent receptor, partial [Candidatus Cloacimonetes bacterium]|nr:TonB-dependent receptor [Candidatus Cloacimonadota bacterium]